MGGRKCAPCCSPVTKDCAITSTEPPYTALQNMALIYVARLFHSAELSSRISFTKLTTEASAKSCWCLCTQALSTKPCFSKKAAGASYCLPWGTLPLRRLCSNRFFKNRPDRGGAAIDPPPCGRRHALSRTLELAVCFEAT